MTDLQLQQEKEKNRLLIELSASYRNLKAQTDIWENRYLLIAPVSGKCIFTQYRSINQNITVGESVLSIIPIDTDKIIGRMLLPIQGAGKVKKNQRVNIRLENFPYMEFGQLEGKISKIAEMPDKKGFYYIEVQFPNGMITSYGKQVPFSQNIHGQAEIITKNIRLLYRIIQPIRSLFTENT
jgi:HlyD family secretion protein